VKTRFDQIGHPLYCDARAHEGDTRVDLMISLYLSPQEYARYQRPESLRITLGEPVAAGGTAEPSTERPTGDDGRPARPAPTPATPRRAGAASTAKEHSDGRP
jgi:hypothetical protein